MFRLRSGQYRFQVVSLPRNVVACSSPAAHPRSRTTDPLEANVLCQRVDIAF